MPVSDSKRVRVGWKATTLHPQWAICRPRPCSPYTLPLTHQLAAPTVLRFPVPGGGHLLNDLGSTYSFKQHIVVFRLRGPISERVHDYDFRGARPWPARASRRHAPPYASPVATAYGLMLERATEAAAASL